MNGNLFIFLAVLITWKTTSAAKFQLTREQKKCLEQDKFYHGMTNQCYALRTQGPCQRNERLVLKKPDPCDEKVETICREYECGDMQYYWAQEKRCINRNNQNEVCGSDDTMTLTEDIFGDGECSCLPSPPHARLQGDPKYPCTQLYHQGNCRDGFILVYKSVVSTVATCERDPCYHLNALRNQENPPMVLNRKDGVCYELDTPGPCRQGSQWRISSSYQPICTTLGLRIDPAGLCVHEPGGKQCKNVMRILSNRSKNRTQKILDQLQRKLNSARG